MKNHILTIVKKELARFSGDRRMLFTALLPGILIFVMYSVMGEGFGSMMGSEGGEMAAYSVLVNGLPKEFENLKSMENILIEEISDAEVEEHKEMIKDGLFDILVIFPESFVETAVSYDPATATTAAPNVRIYYNSVNTASLQAYEWMKAILASFEESLANRFDVCAGDEIYDFATASDIGTMMAAMLMPMLLMTFIYTGCMSEATESIAGEKERGTIATLLVTPMSRRDLALGKILSLSVIGLISATSSFLGTMLSLPKLMKGSGLEEMEFSYSTLDYLLLFVIILATTFLIVGALSILSTFAKSVKEAGTLCTPFMIVILMCSFTGMLGVGTGEDWYLYLIPIYNSVQCMGKIFSMEMEILPILVTAVANFCYTGVTVALLTRMFQSERIMYTK